MDYYNSAEILEEMMDLFDFSDSQVEAMELAIQVLKEKDEEQDDLR